MAKKDNKKNNEPQIENLEVRSNSENDSVEVDETAQEAPAVIPEEIQKNGSTQRTPVQNRRHTIADSVFVEITSACVVRGAIRKKGAEVEISAKAAKQLIASGKAKVAKG